MSKDPLENNVFKVFRHKKRHNETTTQSTFIAPKRKRVDLSKTQKRESFFLFYPEARNAAGAEKGYPCIICNVNIMHINGTNSWNACHIKPIRNCPLKDPKYIIPACSACNGRMGLSDATQMNAFDMMIINNYAERIYPIVKVLHSRYADENTSVLSFVYETYGIPTRNFEGAYDPRLIIESPRVYEEIASNELEEKRSECERNIDEKTSQIHDIHEQIKKLLSKVEDVRVEERNAIKQSFQRVADYEAERAIIFKNSKLFT